MYKISYYPEPNSWSRKKLKVELNLSNYATKSDAKIVACVDTSKFANKADLGGLKSEVV